MSTGISYELALKLKNAGFSQGLRGILEDGHHEVPVYLPTLEELIEACGNSFGSLERIFGVEHKTEYWLAETCCGDFTSKREPSEGSTPSEAVAKLYLSINKK